MPTKAHTDTAGSSASPDKHADGSGEAIAFIVYGRGITVAQRDAGLAAMNGTFKASDVRHALARAGVEDEPAQSYTVERAADRLMQAERRARRIRAINNKVWERVA